MLLLIGHQSNKRNVIVKKRYKLERWNICFMCQPRAIDLDEECFCITLNKDQAWKLPRMILLLRKFGSFLIILFSKQSAIKNMNLGQIETSSKNQYSFFLIWYLPLAQLFFIKNGIFLNYFLYLSDTIIKGYIKNLARFYLAASELTCERKIIIWTSLCSMNVMHLMFRRADVYFCVPIPYEIFTVYI